MVRAGRNQICGPCRLTISQEMVSRKHSTMTPMSSIFPSTSTMMASSILEGMKVTSTIVARAPVLDGRNLFSQV